MGETSFPLVAKDDIDEYEALGVINAAFKTYYDRKRETGHNNAINVLNTTGKNALRDFSSLYLTSLPILGPDYYRTIALSLFPDLPLYLRKEAGHEQSAELTSGWFLDERLERVYRECLLTELIQIIHRTRIRYIRDITKVKICIATTQSDLIKELCKWVRIPEYQFEVENLSIPTAYGFQTKVENMCDGFLAYAERSNRSIINDLPVFIGSVDKTLGTKHRPFLQYHLRNRSRREHIIKSLEERGLRLTGEGTGLSLDWCQSDAKRTGS